MLETPSRVNELVSFLEMPEAVDQFAFGFTPSEFAQYCLGDDKSKYVCLDFHRVTTKCVSLLNPLDDSVVQYAHNETRALIAVADKNFYRCSECDFSASRRYVMLAHVKAAHDGEFVCSLIARLSPTPPLRPQPQGHSFSEVTIFHFDGSHRGRNRIIITIHCIDFEHYMSL